MTPRRIGFPFEYVDSTFYIVIRETLRKKLQSVEENQE
jgi:hypothetical protein